MKKSRFAVLLSFLLGLTALAGAADGSVKELFGIDPMPQMTHIRIAHFSGSPHSLAHYIAQEKGWFTQVNLDVELVPFVNGPAMMEANRSWDVGTTGAPGLISGIVGHDVRMIGFTFWDTLMRLFVREDNPIFKSGKGHIPGFPEIWGKPADWKNTQWLLAAGTTMHLVMLTTISRLGLTDQDLQMVNMDATSAYTAFKAGQGDGLGSWAPTLFQVAESGYKAVSGIEECGVRMASTIFAHPDALANKREMVKKYLDVYLAICHWIDENHEEAAEYFVRTCEEEGINTSPFAALSTLESAHTPTLSEQISYCETIVPDSKDPSRRITEMEKVIMDIFDFFAAQGRYTAEDRVKMLSGFIDSSVVLELKADYQKNGKAIP